MKLLLPLKYYDEAGKVKPSSGLYLCAFFLCRSIILFAGALLSGQYGSDLLKLFYSENKFLYFNLVIAMPTFLALILISFRDKSWLVKQNWLFLCVKPFMLFSAVIDLLYHIFYANLNHWQFSWIVAITLILDVLCVYFLLKGKHLSFMIKDWRSPATNPA